MPGRFGESPICITFKEISLLVYAIVPKLTEQAASVTRRFQLMLACDELPRLLSVRPLTVKAAHCGTIARARGARITAQPILTATRRSCAWKRAYDMGIVGNVNYSSQTSKNRRVARPIFVCKSGGT